MIAVFWLAGQQGSGPQSQHRSFAADQLAQALQFAEDLRRRRRAGESISHVAIQSEPIDSVGEAGVADAAADYAHYKRRLDPSVPLGRASAVAAAGGRDREPPNAPHAPAAAPAGNSGAA
ncbi:hypothetical protein WG922_01745 [Ramlibacter sp. AN1015]|uniref:hypothetical protein n=1 Tax=Ramlibacter sp. AN1015 TaxID=3133428 RepID=UPI0030C30F1A